MNRLRIFLIFLWRNSEGERIGWKAAWRVATLLSKKENR